MEPDQGSIVPIYAPRGSMVLYDNATFHTRLDGTAEPSLQRRTLHQYFSRGGWFGTRGPTPAQTDWSVFPKRLARSADPRVVRLFSHWTITMGEWAATDWSDEYRATMGKDVPGARG